MPALLERKEEYGPAPGPAYGPIPGSIPGSIPDPIPDPMPDPMPEKVLARLWQKRAARQREFRTSAGQRVRVLYAGRPGTAAGPDFRDALLEVEGLGLVQGDVELHLRQQDWYAHGHADDPNYNGVVLHAALETSPQPTNLHSGHRAPVISLAALLEVEEPPATGGSAREREESKGDNLWAILAERGWPRPAEAKSMGQLLDAAGDARFQARAAVFASFNREQPPSQTLYEGLLEALGYRANRQPFLKLAQRAPWDILAGEARAHPREARVAVIENRLLQLSGLTGLSGDRKGKRRLPSGYGKPLQAEEWHTFRVRPANHPRHRIAGAARLLARFLESPDAASSSETAIGWGAPTGPGRLVAALTEIVAGGNAAKLTAALTVKGDGTDGGSKVTAFVGADRAKDMAVNVVLPFCHAIAESGGEEGEGAALALFKKFGKLQENEITREMADQLLMPEWSGVVTGARRQQGLIHLHRQLAG